MLLNKCYYNINEFLNEISLFSLQFAFTEGVHSGVAVVNSNYIIG